MKTFVFATTLVVVGSAAPLAAENRIDGQSPDVPDLSAYGPYDVGVWQFDFANPDQIDMVNIDPATDPATALPRYDRSLSVEMRYPAMNGASGDTTLDAYIRDGVTQVELKGRAVRDAAPRTGEGLRRSS